MTAFRPSRSLFIVTAAIAGLSFAGAAAAADGGSFRSVEVAQVVVDYSDLDLDTERGVAALQRRIRTAAREVCGSPGSRELAVARRAHECREAAIARAVEQVGSSRLAKLNAGGSRAQRS